MNCAIKRQHQEFEICDTWGPISLGSQTGMRADERKLKSDVVNLCGRRYRRVQLLETGKDAIVAPSLRFAGAGGSRVWRVRTPT